MPARSRNTLLEQLEDLDDPTPKDFDPEDEPPHGSDSSEAGSDDGSNDADGGREHYVGVGKSTLRKAERASLGPRYEGSRITRDAALGTDRDDDDDPFTKGFGDEFSDSEASDDGDGGQEPGVDGSTEASSVGTGDSAHEEGDGGGEENGDDGTRDKSAPADVLEALAQDRQRATKGQAQHGAKADGEKGRAVRAQRATFDALLNARIKLQKALIGANTLAGLARDNQPDASQKHDPEGQDIGTAFRAAETAALNLWNSLASLRSTLSDTRTGTKRSHEEASSTATPLSTLCTRLRSQNAASRPFEDETLAKWYRKTHEAETLTSNARNLNLKGPAPASSVQNVLSDALSDNARLLKRARTPRSCAPYQLARASGRAKQPAQPHGHDSGDDDGDPTRIRVDAGDATIYDDADFYSVLLTTLLEQRSATAAVLGTNGQGTEVDLARLNGYQIRREAKTRRVGVDTKASKGRKLRYTVHEKLLDYMAPEDRSMWGPRQVDELFGSLLGRKMVLDEDDGDEDVGVGDHQAEIGAADARTLLFGR